MTPLGDGDGLPVAAVISVFYPLADGMSFDMDYYLSTHLPLVRRLLEPMGLRETRVMAGVPSGTGQAPFHVVAELLFDDEESLAAALAAHGPQTQADIPNFTDAVPLIQISRVVVRPVDRVPPGAGTRKDRMSVQRKPSGVIRMTYCGACHAERSARARGWMSESCVAGRAPSQEVGCLGRRRRGGEGDGQRLEAVQAAKTRRQGATEAGPDIRSEQCQASSPSRW